MPAAADVLTELYETLQERKGADADSSYVARLYRDGLDAILKKIGEEATETVIAAKGADRAALVHELADLWFHSLVLMAAKDVPLSELTGELARRRGRSGLDEHAARPASGGPRAARSK
jgi:phosphoribosyl-ATP pyrophosphohydrolase